MKKLICLVVLSVMLSVSCVKERKLLGTITAETVLESEDKITLYDTDYEFKFKNSRDVGSARVFLYKKGEDEDGEEKNTLIKEAALNFSSRKGSVNSGGLGTLKSGDKFQLSVRLDVDGTESTTDFEIEIKSALSIDDNDQDMEIDSKGDVPFGYKVTTVSDAKVDAVNFLYKVVKKGANATRIAYTKDNSFLASLSVDKFGGNVTASKLIGKFSDAADGDRLLYAFETVKGSVKDTVTGVVNLKTRYLGDQYEVEINDKETEGSKPNLFYNLDNKTSSSSKGHLTMSAGGRLIDLKVKSGNVTSRSVEFKWGSTTKTLTFGAEDVSFVKFKGSNATADEAIFKKGNLLQAIKSYDGDVSTSVTEFTADPGYYYYKVTTHYNKNEGDTKKEPQVATRVRYGMIKVGSVGSRREDKKEVRYISLSLKSGIKR